MMCNVARLLKRLASLHIVRQVMSDQCRVVAVDPVLVIQVWIFGGRLQNWLHHAPAVLALRCTDLHMAIIVP